MQLQTLLQILFANGHENVVAHAVKIDSGIEDRIPETIVAQVYKSELEGDQIFENERSSGYLECKVIHFDKFKMSDQYTIELPNGKFKQASDRTGRETITKVTYPANA